MLNNMANGLRSLFRKIDENYSTPISLLLVLIPFILAVTIIYALVYLAPTILIISVSLFVISFVIIIIRSYYSLNKRELDIQEEYNQIDKERIELMNRNQNSPQHTINKLFEEDLFNKAIEERFHEMVSDITNDAFGKNSDVRKAIQKDISESIDNHIEDFDFNTQIKNKMKSSTDDIDNNDSEIHNHPYN